MKLFTTSQIRVLDQYTIEHEPISSASLMERAANRILLQFKKDIRIGSDILILAGPGNNGGDGLALGRMLLQVGYDVEIILINPGKLSPDCKLNKERLTEYFPDTLSEISHSFSPAELSEKAIIVDAVFGSGLSRPLTGIFREVVEWINNSGRKIISIDIPTGLNGEACAKKDDTIVRADLTYSLQFPKLSFFFAENEEYVGEWKVIDIQLLPHAIDKTETDYFYIEKEDIRPLLQPRSRFSHKGTFGHALIWAGKKGMAGAAILASKGALRAGAGLLSVHSVEENRQILQTAVPEAIFLTKIKNPENYTSCAFGPGIGTSNEASEILFQLLESIQSPCILDADALNIISENKRFLSLIPT
ncbi:MAG: NAD(P)H-hydrate epimerase, partial [Paludibacteraceae bacterium]